MVDKTKQSPLPERTSQIGGRESFEKQAKPDRQGSGSPKFVRGTIDPSTKKEER